MSWEGDWRGREASARLPPWLQESRCQGRGWAAPSCPSTAVWTSASSERRGREGWAPHRSNPEKARSGTFPGPRERSGSPPHSLSPDTGTSSPQRPSQPETSNDGCWPSRPARWASWSPPPQGPSKHSKREPWGPRGRRRRPGPCQSRLTRSYPGGGRRQVSDHRQGTCGGVFRDGRSHVTHTGSPKLRSISLSPGHSGERGP